MGFFKPGEIGKPMTEQGAHLHLILLENFWPSPSRPHLDATAPP
jgi:hypothetical protein